MSAFQPISAPRLYRMIANQIRTKIVAGDYQPGERLPSERDLAEMLAVSRPSVREALIALELEGFVDVRVGTGVFVTLPASPQRGAALAPLTEPLVAAPQADIGARDLLEARMVVEPACAELAARNATSAQLAAMEAAVMALPTSGEPHQHNDTFHLAIAEASGNAALASTVLHLWKLSENSAIVSKMNQHFVFGEEWEKAHQEHLALLRALQNREPLAARRAMQGHLADVLARFGLDPSRDGDI